jgi:hypothetical protein
MFRNYRIYSSAKQEDFGDAETVLGPSSFLMQFLEFRNFSRLGSSQQRFELGLVACPQPVGLACRGLLASMLIRTQRCAVHQSGPFGTDLAQKSRKQNSRVAAAVLSP